MQRKNFDDGPIESINVCIVVEIVKAAEMGIGYRLIPKMYLEMVE